MTKKQNWRTNSYLRVIIKDRKTPIIKKRDGRTAGGVSLTDETVKPYEEQLASLEAKVKEAKEQMTTVERMDDNTTEIVYASRIPPRPSWPGKGCLLKSQ